MYQNEILQATSNCYLLREDQLFRMAFKAGCINKGISGKITIVYELVFSYTGGSVVLE